MNSEAKQDIQTLLEAGWKAVKRDAVLKNKLIEVYKKAGQDICSFCPSVLHDKYNGLRNNNLFNKSQTIIPMKERRIFLNDASLREYYTGVTYLRDTITEEQAVKIIQSRPELRKHFGTAPGVNIDDLIAEYEKKAQGKSKAARANPNAPSKAPEASKTDAKTSKKEEVKDTKNAPAKSSKANADSEKK